MLRSALLYTVSVLVALGILVTSLFAATFRSIHAAPSVRSTRAVLSVQAAKPTPTVSPTPTPINYSLPYPGLLPDSPFWFLKALRDRILLITTFESGARVDRLLLYADKRLAAAKVLIEGGKADIGITTAVKGEKYLTEAIQEFLKSNTGSSSGAERLKTATLKHAQDIKSLQTLSPDLTHFLSEAADINRSAQELLK
jgi:hypothetical protein